KGKETIPGQTCTPATCASLNYNCGNWTDGCSGTLSCGVFGNESCQTGYNCVSGSCVLISPTCTPAVCGTPGYMCGYRNNETCPGTLNCGNCTSGTCVGGSCVSNTSVLCGPSRTYYIDFVNGNDNDNGTCSNSAWKRHPYMVGFSGSYTHRAGDRFIFKGGVIWSNSSFPLTINAGGSAAAGNDYYGVDKRWYSGGLWTKPVFDGQYVSNILISLLYDRSYITVDNLELKRVSTPNSQGDGLILGGWNNSNLLFKNLYLHGWRTTALSDDAHGGLLMYYSGNSITNPIVNVVLENSEIENSENTGLKQNGLAIRQVQTIRNCSIHDVSSAVLFTADFHDNELYNVGYPDGNRGFDTNSSNPYHCNGVYLDGGYLAVNGTLVSYVYNNKIYDWLDGANGIYPNPHGQVQYIWNNLIYGIQSAQGAIEIDPYDYGGSNGGSAYVWSNTIVNYNNMVGINVVYRSEVKLCKQWNLSFIFFYNRH
ncbi:MAG: hypothetical protein NTU63_00555, partial [Candidatus Pacearchaeota archaeon]|nr:hypothetical protein [Candidatus Pacearchaeota archaeon]